MVKKPLDPSWRSTSPFGFHHCLIHLTRSFSIGHVPMNLAIIAWSFMYCIFSSRLPGRISYPGISIDLGRQVLDVYYVDLLGSFCSILLGFLPLSGGFLSTTLFTWGCLAGCIVIFCWCNRIQMLDEEGRLYCAMISLYEGGSFPFMEEAMDAKSSILLQLSYMGSRVG